MSRTTVAPYSLSIHAPKMPLEVWKWAWKISAKIHYLEKKAPQQTTYLFRSKEVGNIRTTCQQWRHNCLIAHKHVQYIFSSVMSVSKLPLEAPTALPWDVILSEFLLFRFPNQVTCIMLSIFFNKCWMCAGLNAMCSCYITLLLSGDAGLVLRKAMKNGNFLKSDFRIL